jgi:hypothetical protein
VVWRHQTDRIKTTACYCWTYSNKHRVLWLDNNWGKIAYSFQSAHVLWEDSIQPFAGVLSLSDADNKCGQRDRCLPHIHLLLLWPSWSRVPKFWFFIMLGAQFSRSNCFASLCWKGWASWLLDPLFTYKNPQPVAQQVHTTRHHNITRSTIYFCNFYGPSFSYIFFRYLCH